MKNISIKNVYTVIVLKCDRFIWIYIHINNVFIDIQPGYYFNKKDNIHRSEDQEIR